MIGYSERLALLFNQALSRQIIDGNEYIGAAVGESLTRAKRQYIQTVGPGGFSVYDEKVLAQTTLYGLPLIRAQVDEPVPPEFGTSFDPQPLPIPAAIRAGLPAQNGFFTRIFTFTNAFDPPIPEPNSVPRITTRVEDSFDPGTATTIIGTPQMSPGRPVLPVLSYDITLQENPEATNDLDGIPLPVGARLRSAISTLDSFEPHVTTLVTNLDAKPGEPAMTIRNEWLPPIPYAVQRTSTISDGEELATDRLIVAPAQFNATDSSNGQLRRFTRMVFEIHYRDPRTAAAAPFQTMGVRLADWWNPLSWFSGPSSDKSQCRGNTCADPNRLLAAAPASSAITLLVRFINIDSAAIAEATVTYTNNEATWQRAELKLGPDKQTFQVDLPSVREDSGVVAFIEAVGRDGSVSVETTKGTIPDLSNRIFLPFVRR